jgi:hypothetical protein
MTKLWRKRIGDASLLLAVVATATMFGPAGPFAAANAPSAVTGLGFWAALSCVGCLTGFIVGAGTTVAGLAVFLAANPEIAILCVSTCAAAV